MRHDYNGIGGNTLLFLTNTVVFRANTVVLAATTVYLRATTFVIWVNIVVCAVVGIVGGNTVVFGGKYNGI